MQRHSIVRAVMAAVASIPLIAGALAAIGSGMPDGANLQAAQPPVSFPASSQPSQIIATGSISGTVVALASGEPIGDATVSLYSQRIAGGRAEIATDAQGRFAFRELPAGRYRLGASRQGFVRINHGQRRADGGGQPFTLADGEQRTIDLQLPRQNVIAGRVVDGRGGPIAGAFVHAMTRTMNMGYPQMRSVTSARTDLAGNYRLQWLQASEYVVCASTTSPGPLMSEAQRLRAEIDRLKNLPFGPNPEGRDAEEKNAAQIAEMEARLPAQLGPVFGYAPVCNPKGGPQAIALAPGEERHGVDFQLPDTQLARIEGVVRGAPNALAMNPITLVHADDVPGGEMRDARPSRDGRFTFRDVPPGRYLLVCRGERLSPSRPERKIHENDSYKVRLCPTAEVTVDKQDIKDVVVDFARVAAIGGRVVWNGTGARPDLSRVEVRVDPVPTGTIKGYGLVTTRADPNGQFALTNVTPGVYRLSANDRSENYPETVFVESITIAGQDALAQPLELKADQTISGAVVTLTDRYTELSGTILEANGYPATEYMIVLYPTDQRFWNPDSRRRRVTRAHPNGSYVMRGMLPGDYYIATVLDPEFGDWFKPGFMEQLEPMLRVTIGVEEKKVQHLRVPGGR
jgi:carboxypeptidase family protein